MFEHEYDINSLCRVRPLGRSFELYVTPRYMHHYVACDYEALTANLLGRTLARAEMFIDVGAHYGFFAILAAHAHPELEVVAVEPTPVSCEILRRNVEAAGRGNIVVRQAAVSSVPGTATFLLSAASDNCSFYEHPNAPPIGTAEVVTVSVDSLLEGRSPKRLVIKIDTDGHELQVLAGMRQTLQRCADLRLVIEFNPKMQRAAGHEPEELLVELDRLGFAMVFVDDHTRRFFRLDPDGDWRAMMDPAGYANLYCVPKDRAINVVLFSHSAGLAGAERSLIELVDELIADHGAVCTVVAPTAGPLVDAVARSGAAVVITDLPWWAFVGDRPYQATAREQLVDAIGGFCAELAPLLRRIGPDVLYTQTMVIPWGALAAGLLGRPHVWHVCEFGELDHGLTFTDTFTEILAAIDAGSSIVLTNSDVVRATLFPNLECSRTRTVYRHIPIPAAITPASEVYRHPAATKLGLFGTMVPGKGQIEAVEAVAELARRGRDIALLLAGELCNDDYRLRVTRLIEECGLTDRVTIAGFLAEPYPAMAATDVVLICSRREAFGRVAVEAMRLGKPVVYSRSGGVAEYMVDGETGLSYTAGKVDELVDAIEALIDDPARAERIAAAGRRLAAEKFSRDGYGGEVFRVLGRLRSSKQAPIQIPQRLMSAMVTAVADVDKTTTAWQARFDERGAEIERLQHAFAQRDADVGRLRRVVTDCNSEVGRLRQVVADRDARIGFVEAKLATTRDSISWKVTAPMREAGRLIRRLSKLIRRLSGRRL